MSLRSLSKSLSAPFKGSAKQSGFSLVELMVVVTIIAVLATLALPRFRVFQAKARQAEAKANLAHMYSLEQAYWGENDIYVNVGAYGRTAAQCSSSTAIGFQLDNCGGSRYEYSVSGSTATNFLADARSGATASNLVLTNCAADNWTLDQDKTLTPVNDVTVTCNVGSGGTTSP